jgi:alkanesulfonate monooxygenase SsuD/methylene tetrahydromethanopterin reductase-like flavin-dependent oxidoreductase (luciferase family)
MVAHIPIVVSTDREAVREASLKQFGFYPRLPFYSAMFQDAGFPEAKDGTFSPAMADALVISGSEEEVATRLGQVHGYAVDEIIATIVALPGDASAWQRTVEVLGALAKDA